MARNYYYVMKRFFSIIFCLLIASMTIAKNNDGKLSMPAVYSDNMVLQCDRDIVLTGTARKGARVKVQIQPCFRVYRGCLLAPRTRLSFSTRADGNGQWRITLPKLPAGGPYRIVVKSGTNEQLVFDDVWMGDVWLFSGQSNMTFKVCEMSAEDAKAVTEEVQKQPVHVLYMQERYLTNNQAWSIEALDDVNAFNYFDLSAGWQRSSDADVQQFSAIAMQMAAIVADSLKRHIGVIINSVGGSATESWIPRQALEERYPEILSDWKNNDIIQPWVRQRARENSALRDTPEQWHPYAPTYLFRAGNEPMGDYALKGVVWYQGESNAHDVKVHERLFPLLVDSWRYWQMNEKMPFLFVQLSSMNRETWPEFRDSQRRLAEQIDDCWMAVCSDVGDSLDVHPKRKRPVAQRLAAQALGNVYGYDVETQGPTIEQATFDKDGNVVLTFSHAEGLHFPKEGVPANAFEFVYDDGKTANAIPRIKDNTVILQKPETKPHSVRFAWQPFTRAIVYNKVGYPASTFIKPLSVASDSYPEGEQ